MRIELTVLGSGTCAVVRERSCSAYSLRFGDQMMLLDVGFGALRRLAESGLDYRSIDSVLISHLHPDHVADLVPLIMALRFTPDFHRQAPLSIYGPPGLLAYLQAQDTLYGDWVLQRSDFSVEVKEIAQEIELESCRIVALPMRHKSVSYGYRLIFDSFILAYSGDTGYCPQVVSLFSKADCGILECSFPDDRMMDEHLTPSLAGRIAREANCRRLLLSHFYPNLDPALAVSQCRRVFPGPVQAANDLMVLVLGDQE
ncbi:MBL fold metallo-hydrolase [candidate division KSB1 bacterium]|nr:MBL fold metallo-hydrolase [candidate division KSB1 bacterium]